MRVYAGSKWTPRSREQFLSCALCSVGDLSVQPEAALERASPSGMMGTVTCHLHALPHTPAPLGLPVDAGLSPKGLGTHGMEVVGRKCTS